MPPLHVMSTLACHSCMLSSLLHVILAQLPTIEYYFCMPCPVAHPCMLHLHAMPSCPPLHVTLACHAQLLTLACYSCMPCPVAHPCMLLLHAMPSCSTLHTTIASPPLLAPQTSACDWQCVDYDLERDRRWLLSLL